MQTEIIQGTKPLKINEFNSFLEKYSDDIKNGYIIVEKTTTITVEIRRKSIYTDMPYRESDEGKVINDKANYALKKIGFRTDLLQKIHSTKINYTYCGQTNHNK